MEKEKLFKTEYITQDEVRKICKEIGIDDWTKIKETKINLKEAKIILDIINIENLPIDLYEFATGLNIELEHGIRYKSANITNNHPLITGKIVLAHMKESLDYYKFLTVAELRIDLLKAIISKNIQKIKSYYQQLSEAEKSIVMVEIKQLSE